MMCEMSMKTQRVYEYFTFVSHLFTNSLKCWCMPCNHKDLTRLLNLNKFDNNKVILMLYITVLNIYYVF